jgi:hypothetical protein
VCITFFWEEIAYNFCESFHNLKVYPREKGGVL